MNLQFSGMSRGLAAMVVSGIILMTPAVMTFDEARAADDIQVLTRGPVHEAFAEIVNFNPQAGLIVRATPPAPIEELPPEQQPVGDNVQWISGYWGWDDERGQFIWVSGVWRNLPPGRQWVPGYWSPLSDGQYQWTSGYWADAKTSEVTYIATPPPRNIDTGANVEAPSEAIQCFNRIVMVTARCAGSAMEIALD